jgi:hypothetical protein
MDRYRNRNTAEHSRGAVVMHWDLGQRIMLWAWRVVSVSLVIAVSLCALCGVAMVVAGHWPYAMVCFLTAAGFATMATLHRRFWRAFVR